MPSLLRAHAPRLVSKQNNLMDGYVFMTPNAHLHACGHPFLKVVNTSSIFLIRSSPVIGRRTFRPNSWCEKTSGLSDGQRKLCHRVPGLQIAMKKGIGKGLSECEREFKWNRWNCTLLGEHNLLQRAPGGSLSFVRQLTQRCLC